ncbi:hypothetical protein AB0K80_33400 [Streptomyces sp. NPDC052682]|uniref:hypothetical protein n=1 Tax=Streptomyces sp. NPDC052682 TaxID=3154954 RepID=UPI00343509AD
MELLVILLAIGFCVFFVLLPTRSWLHGPSARVILERWKNGANTKVVKADVAAAMVGAQRRNSDELTKRSWAYRVAVVLRLSQVLVLAAAVARSSA